MSTFAIQDQNVINLAKYYKDFNRDHQNLLTESFGREGYAAELKTKFMTVTADASVKNATSHVVGEFRYPLTDDVSALFRVSTPQHYLMKFTSDFKDRYFNTGAKLNHLSFSADIECDEAHKTYPTTFHANMLFNNQVAAHAQVMTERGNNLEAQLDVYAKLYQDIFAGGEIVYDDKAKSLILRKYGLFWQTRLWFSTALEYGKVGDKETIDASFYHIINPITVIGSTFSFDTQIRKIAVNTAVAHALDDNISYKARVNNHGDVDFLLKARISPSLLAEFSSGCNLSGFFHGKTHDEAYTGLNFKFTL